MATSTSGSSAQSIAAIQKFFERPVAMDAVRPLRDGVEIGVHLPDQKIVSLKKTPVGMQVVDKAPNGPDLSIFLGDESVDSLTAISADDVGDIGVEILKLMAHADPKKKIRAKVHIGLFSFLRNGYLSILPLGGKKVAQFLASKGLSGLGKIKAAIDSLRS